jgi:hypothetical protein
LSNGLDVNKPLSDKLKTSSLDRRVDMPKLATVKDKNWNNQSDSEKSENSTSNKTDIGESHAVMEERKNEINSSSNGSAVFHDANNDSDISGTDNEEDKGEEEKEKEEDMDSILDADINAEEEFEKSMKDMIKSTESKGIVLLIFIYYHICIPEATNCIFIKFNLNSAVFGASRNQLSID